MKSYSHKKYYDIILFSGNRQNEDGPLITFSLEAEKLDYSFFIVIGIYYDGVNIFGIPRFT